MHSDTLMPKNNKRESDKAALAQNIIQDGMSIASANPSSEAATAYFHTTRRKSLTTNGSPLPDKDLENIRNVHEDPLTFLKKYDV